MASPVISFRDGHLSEELQERGSSTGLIAQRDLSRYYILLRDALRRLSFTEQEASLLCDALNGSLNDFNINPAQCLHFTVVDAIALDRLDKKWNVDGSALLQKLKGLDTLKAAAVIDAVERFWHEPDSYSISSISEKLKKVGLI